MSATRPTNNNNNKVMLAVLAALALVGAGLSVWWVSGERDSTPAASPDARGRAAALSDDEPSKWGEVQGVVYEVRTDEPVPGATVRVLSGGGETVTSTDASGSFRLQVADKAITLLASAPGLRSGGRSDDGVRVVVPEGSNLERVQIFLYEPAEVTGRVRHNGVPVDAVVMGWVLRDASGAEGYAIDEVVTDVDGMFRLGGLPPARMVIRVTAEGFAPFESAVLDVYAGDLVDMGDLDLLPGARVAGTILEKGTDIPLPGARLRIRPLQPRGAEMATRSNEDGDFAFYGVPAGQVEISMDAPGYRKGLAELSVAVGEERTFDIELEPLTGIVVRVVDATGRVVRGARVEVRSSPDAELLRTYPVEDGDVVIDDLQGGPYAIRAHSETTGLEVIGMGSAGETVVLTLAALGGVRGMVLRADGSVASDARVRLLVADDAGNQTVREDWRETEGGRFLFESLEPKLYFVEASAAEHRDTASEPLLVTDRQTSTTLRLEQAGSLFGTVYDGATGAPLEQASVRLESSRMSVQTDDMGHYQLSSFPQGRHTVVVAKPGYRSELVSGIEIGAGQRQQRDITLSQSDEHSELSVVGIGTRLQEQEGRIVVLEPLDGAAAQRAGLQSGDVVVSVDGVDAQTLGFASVLEAIRGEEGTAVRLMVERDGAQFEILVQRETVVFEGR